MGTMLAQRAVDVTVTVVNAEGLVMIEPITDKACAWIRENMGGVDCLLAHYSSIEMLLAQMIAADMLVANTAAGVH